METGNSQIFFWSWARFGKSPIHDTGRSGREESEDAAGEGVGGTWDGADGGSTFAVCGAALVACGAAVVEFAGASWASSGIEIKSESERIAGAKIYFEYFGFNCAPLDLAVSYGAGEGVAARNAAIGVGPDQVQEREN
jgi:hypothetical protein